MALSALAPVALDLATSQQLPMATGPNGDMDIDMDIDLGPMEEVISEAEVARTVCLFRASSSLLSVLQAEDIFT